MTSKRLHLDIVLLLFFLLAFSGFISLLHAGISNLSDKDIWHQISPFLISRNEKKIADFIAHLPADQQKRVVIQLLDDQKIPLQAQEKISLVFRVANTKKDNKSKKELLTLVQTRPELVKEVPLLYVAGAKEYLSLIPLLIENIKDPTKRQEWAYKALEYAFGQNEKKVAIDLLSQLKLDSNVLNKLLWFVLAQRKDHQFVDMLVQKGADVNNPKNGKTPLIQAIENNSLETVKALVDAGASVNFYADPLVGTPLQAILRLDDQRRKQVTPLELYLREHGATE